MFKKTLETMWAGTALQAMSKILPIVKRHTGESCAVETNNSGGYTATVAINGVIYEIPARIIPMSTARERLSGRAFMTAVWFNEAIAKEDTPLTEQEKDEARQYSDEHDNGGYDRWRDAFDEQWGRDQQRQLDKQWEDSNSDDTL